MKTALQSALTGLWLTVAGLLLAAGTATAQQFKWVDREGRVQYGDTPPPGVKATRLKAPVAPVPQPAAAPDAKGARKGPLTPAEQEAEFRKRQKAAQEEAGKTSKQRAEDEAAKQNCSNARESLATLESGQRLARTNAQGERYILDDAQRESDLDKARRSVSQWCR